MNQIPVLNVAGLLAMIENSIKANTPLHIIGSPGIGKTAILGQVAKKLGMPLYVLILAQCMPEDIGGVPSVVDGKILRLPIGPIAKACLGPCVLFFDEYSQASPPMQGASLRPINEREAGDSALHEYCRMILASNEAHESAAGNPITPPALNRMTQVKFVPDLDEISSYFQTLGAPGSILHTLALDFAATISVESKLLTLSPPKGTAQTGNPWGSPRAWERALRLCAEIQASTGESESELFVAALAGNVGESSANAWLALRKVRTELPSVDEMAKDPEHAKLPETSATKCAVIGLLPQVALRSPCAAWVYAARLDPEFRLIGGKALFKFMPGADKKSPHFAQALRAQAMILGQVGALKSA